MLLQRVRAEPGRQAFFGAFSPQNEVSGNEDFRLNFPLPSIPSPSHSSRPIPHLFPLILATKRLNCGQGVLGVPCMHIHSAYDVQMSVWTSIGSGRSPAAERFLLHFELKTTPLRCEFCLRSSGGETMHPCLGCLKPFQRGDDQSQCRGSSPFPSYKSHPG